MSKYSLNDASSLSEDTNTISIFFPAVLIMLYDSASTGVNYLQYD
jgi:hypothetical protein